MFQWIFGAIVMPLLFMIFTHYFETSPGNWLPAILAAVVAFGGLWATKGIVDWEDTNGGDNPLSYIGKMLGLLAFVYGGIATFILGAEALDASKRPGAPSD